MSDLRASLAAVRCFLADLPLFFRREPRTPLRVLGIVSLDTLHVLRHSRRLPRPRVDALALFLDLEGCANAAWDRKDVCHEEWNGIRERLAQAGLGSCVDTYLARLQQLESCRPSVGGDDGRFAQVRAYRESVARLSISTAAAIALNPAGHESDIPAHADSDVDALFLILMQCQIIDDIFDYSDDLAAGLPSFLTASASLAQGLASTAAAARYYGGSRGRSTSPGVFPFRATLRLVTSITTFLVSIYGLTHSRRTHDATWRWTTTSGR